MGAASAPGMSIPGRNNARLRSAVAILLILASASISRATTVGTFDDAPAVAAWTFSNGPEFPGATGSLSSGGGHPGTGAHLAYDTSAGGNYVAAVSVLSTPVAASTVRLWVKTPGGVRVQIRVNDSTGQTLQYSPNRPFEATDPDQWYQLNVLLTATPDHFGGTVSDGTVHGGITAISVLAQPTTTKVGAIDFDSVKLISPPVPTIDITAAPVTSPATTDFTGSVGVEITHDDATDTGLDLVQSLGFAYIATEMLWANVETTAGVYDFSYYDNLLASLQARGLRAQFILGYGNLLYTGTTGVEPPRTPAEIQAFARFAGAAAAHYAGQGAKFEVWNEPDIATYWSPPDAGAYDALYQACAAQMHLADPSAVVLTGGLAGTDVSFLDDMIAADGISAANAIGLHPYRLEAPEQLSADLLDLRTNVARAFPVNTPPIWSTEAGYSSAWYGDGTAADNRLKQAKYSVRQMLTGLALGLPSQTVFDLRDTGTDATATEENFGIVDSAYQPKPLTAAVQTLLAQCRGRRFEGVMSMPDSDLHVLKFVGDSDTLLVVWSESPTGAAQRLFFSKLPLQALDAFGQPVRVVTTGKNKRSIKVADAPVYVTFHGQH